MSIDSLSQMSTPDPLAMMSGPDGGPVVHKGVQTVLLDADDTLWENNLFFLRTIEWLCVQGRRHGHTDVATINILNHWETFNIARMGYGYDSYEASFLMTIRALVARSGRDDLHPGLYRQARAHVAFLTRHPIVWLAGVEATLPELTRRFRTIIVTKGNYRDQMGKVDRCGMKHLFAAAEVVPEKKPGNYAAVMEKHGLDPASTVMVGNSPRSDINMPRRAGLRTVYIPNVFSWFREMEPIAREDPPTIEVPTFDRLLDVLKP